MWLALACAIATAIILVLPVHNRPVQNCGSPALFLLRGTPNAALTDDNGKPLYGLDQAGVQRAYDHRCTVEVGRRAWPAALTGTAFLCCGVLALALAFVARHRHKRRARDADLPGTIQEPAAL